MLTLACSFFSGKPKVLNASCTRKISNDALNRSHRRGDIEPSEQDAEILAGDRTYLFRMRYLRVPDHVELLNAEDKLSEQRWVIVPKR